MTLAVLLAVGAGVLAGRAFGPGALAPADTAASWALHALLLVVGFDLGRRREAWRDLVRLGLRAAVVPVLVAVGTLVATAALAWPLGLSPRTAAAIGAGFGWYSLSGVLLTRLADPATGATAFLANVARELLTLLLAVPLARRLGPLAPVAAGGATAMDSTLPLLVRAAGPEAALVGFLSGLALSAASPLLIGLLAGSRAGP